MGDQIRPGLKARPRPRCRAFYLSWCLLFAVGVAEAQEGSAYTIGEQISTNLDTPQIDTAQANQGEAPVWTTEIHSEGATYIAPHFSAFELPAGAWLVLREPGDEQPPGETRRLTYTGNGQEVPNPEEGFWGLHIPGDTAVLELYSREPLPAAAVSIDAYARGLPGAAERAICGQDDSRWAECYRTTDPDLYSRSRAVMRLVINGTSACTGWLVGNEGHVMTNEHCIANASDAANTNFEIMAEGAVCATNCATPLGCPGTIVATHATLVRANASLDYALVKLPVNPTSTYGFLQMRSTGPQIDERIYIPQHPAAWGKRIAVRSDHPQDQSGFCEVSSLSEPGCTGQGPDVGYFADTRGGSSGAPVIAHGDHLVVALHHCANCANRGVPIDRVIADLGSLLPKSSAVDPSCDDPCPTGGVYDGANCYMYSVPGNAPFIWNGGLYYQPVDHPDGPCPHSAVDNFNQVSYPAVFDGANCYLGHYGPNPFIWDNNYYLAAACQGCSNPCPYAGTFDGANCYLFSWPGVSPFIWNNGWYYEPVWHPDGPCPHEVYNNWTGQWVQPIFDGANCYIGAASPGQNAFIWGNNYYQTPVCTESFPLGQGDIFHDGFESGNAAEWSGVVGSATTDTSMTPSSKRPPT